MLETRLILDATARLFARKEEAVLATVVQVSGSVYRRPGARLLVTRNRETIGSVSGGCLEGDLAQKAWWRTEEGSCVVAYDSTADAETAWSLGLGCNGLVHVLLERISLERPGPLPVLRRSVAENDAAVIATAFRADPATGVLVGERLTLDVDGRMTNDFSDDFAERVRADAAKSLLQDQGRTVVYQLPGGEVEIAIEVVRPPIRLIVFGAGFDVSPLVNAAKALGWSTTVVAPRRTMPCVADVVVIAPAATACERLRLDRRTAAVVMNHNFDDDCDAVAALLRSDARYIGVLGPKARTEKMCDDVGGTWDWERLHAPVGLDVGADAPEEIAAAVVAQVLAAFAGRRGGHLRDRPGPIHRVEPELAVETAR
jgi:xanthine dehydrogenase accessory factor